MVPKSFLLNFLPSTAKYTKSTTGGVKQIKWWLRSKMWLRIFVARGLELVHRNRVKKGFTFADYSKALLNKYS